jgi:hypothetical protein
MKIYFGGPHPKQKEREEYYLLGYSAVYSVESQPMFRRNISPPSSGYKNKLNKKPASTLSGLHGVIFQKMVLFKTIAVRTSKPTKEGGNATLFPCRYN